MSVMRRALLLVVFSALIPILGSTAEVSNFGVKPADGAVVALVSPTGAAGKAGLQPGDRIVAFGGTPISSSSDLASAMLGMDAGDYDVDVIRAGSRMRFRFSLTIGSQGRPQLGAYLITGFTVGEVEPGSQADGLGLRAGDVIMKCNDAQTLTFAQFESCVTAIGGGNDYSLQVARGDRRIVLRPGMPETTPGAAAGRTDAPQSGMSDGGRGGRGIPATQGADTGQRGQVRGGAPDTSGRPTVGTVTGTGGESAPSGRDRLRRPQMVAAGGSVPSGGGGNTLLRDAASQKLLDDATAKTQYAVPDSASKRLTKFNVLKYALVATDGTVTLVGAYDPAYATGPIDYDALLRDAVENPYPKFSLDPAGRDPLDLGGLRAVDADMQHAIRDSNYAAQLGTKLLVQPLLKSRINSPDRQYLVQKLNEKFGITRLEFDANAASDGENVHNDLEFLNVGNFTDKLLMGGGAALGCGRLYVALKDWGNASGRPIEEVRQKMERVASQAGLYQRLVQIDAEVRNGGDRHKLGTNFTADIYQTLMTCLRVPEREVSSLIGAFRIERIDEGPLLKSVNAGYTAALQKALLEGVFSSFPLSQATLGRIYNVPPIMSRVNTFGGRRDSAVMRAFFDADYTLKYVTTANLTTATIPGHISSETYITQQQDAAGGGRGRAPNMGNIRYWIRPGDVQMDVIGNRGGVRFVDAKVRIGSEPLALRGGDRRGDELVGQAVSSYADLLSSRYEDYARAFPSLHVMQETAKVIALARWAKAQGMRLQVTGATSAVAPVPDQVEGFWGMTFMYRANSSTDLLYLWAQGGVDFAQGEGDGWIKTQPSPKATNDVLEQLAASTALAEKASAAALSGNMESARDLAQRSADAMTGQIDMSRLPEPVMALAQNESVAGRAEVAQAAIAAAETNTAALAKARTDLQQAEPLKTSDPAQYAQIQQQSQAAATRSEQNLHHLQDMLQKYRLTPTDSSAMVVDLRKLNFDKPRVVAQLSTGTAGRAQGCPIAPKKRLPTRDELVRELAGLRSKLDVMKFSLLRLNRSIQMDQRQFGEWEKETQDAVDRSNERLKQAIEDKIEEGMFEYAEDHYKKAPEKLAAVKNIELLLKEKDAYEWAEKGEKTWDQVAEGVKLLGDVLPLTDQAQDVLWASENIMDSAFDISTELVGWRRISQLQKNSDAYLAAVKQSGEQMKQIVGRIKDVEDRLASGKVAPGGRIQQVAATTPCE